MGNERKLSDETIARGKTSSGGQASELLHERIPNVSPSPQQEIFNEETSSSSGESAGSSENDTIVDSVRVMLEQNDQDENLTTTKKSRDNGRAAVASTNQVKQYKNSPFGLNRHYLTMPESAIGAGGYYDSDVGVDDDNISENDEPTNRVVSDTQRRDWKAEETRGKKVGSKKTKRNQLERVSISSDQSTNDLVTDAHSNQEPALELPRSSTGSWHRRNPIHLQKQHINNQWREDGTKCCDTKCQTECAAVDDADYFRCNPDLNTKQLHNKNSSQEASSLLVKFSSIMYATFLVILGCILHVSELRQKSKNSSDHIYTTIVALIGVAWLLFLQTDLHRYKRYASKYILIETILNDNIQKDLDASKHHNTPSANPSFKSHLPDQHALSRSTTSSSGSLVNGDRLSMNTEVIFKKTAYKMYQQQAAAKGYNHRPRANSKLSQMSSHSIEPKKGTDTKASTYDHENLVPAYKFLHGKMGANFYLKCGMAAFCFGHVIHEGLRFGQQLYFFGTGNAHCSDLAALIAHLVTPLYSFYQLFMMFKYSNLVINRHKILARFGLMHIIGTSITFWFRTILEEAFEDFVHKMDYFKTNKSPMNVTFIPNIITPEPQNHLISLLTTITNAIEAEASDRVSWLTANTTTSTTTTTTPLPIQPDNGTSTTIAQSLLTLMSSPISATITPQIVRHLPDSYACAQNTLLTTRSMNALPYLYPFTIEYNLLLAATFLSLYFNIGKIGVLKSICKPSLVQYSNMFPKPRKNLVSGSHYGSNIESSDNNSSATRTQDSFDTEIGEFKSNFVVNADCHSANKGLFCGFFVLLVTIITIVIFFVTINKPTHVQLGIKINLIQEATLTALILLVTLAGFKQIVKLNRNPYLKDKVTTDDVLMLIPLPFFFMHSLLSFRAKTASMSTGSITAFSAFLLHGRSSDRGAPFEVFKPILAGPTGGNVSVLEPRFTFNSSLASGQRNETNNQFLAALVLNGNNTVSDNGTRRTRSERYMNYDALNLMKVDHFKLIAVALNIIVMIEVLVQTNFIIDGMRRCSETRYLRFKKPGRELITFAILLNITYWIVATFETKSVEQYKTEIEYYGPLPYMFISHTTLPVMLFYRYHSSVCLAEIWNRAYKSPKKR